MSTYFFVDVVPGVYLQDPFWRCWSLESCWFQKFIKLWLQRSFVFFLITTIFGGKFQESKMTGWKMDRLKMSIETYVIWLIRRFAIAMLVYQEIPWVHRLSVAIPSASWAQLRWRWWAMNDGLPKLPPQDTYSGIQKRTMMKWMIHTVIQWYKSKLTYNQWNQWNQWKVKLRALIRCRSFCQGGDPVLDSTAAGWGDVAWSVDYRPNPRLWKSVFYSSGYQLIQQNLYFFLNINTLNLNDALQHDFIPCSCFAYCALF